MKATSSRGVKVLGLVVLWCGVVWAGGAAAAPVLNLPQDIIGCPSDMVRVGPTGVDKYEASVFPNADGSGTQLGVSSDDYTSSAGCNNDGSGCSGIFAVSQAGVTPSTRITWFQAQHACANVGKRLLRNAEWQIAAAETPDSTQCNILSGSVANTGSFGNCQSRWGVFDMVGNVWEWVEDWVPRSTACGSWSVGGNDIQCLAGAATTGEPGALRRGGSSVSSGTFAGVFAVHGGFGPSGAGSIVGFRCARSSSLWSVGSSGVAARPALP